MLIKGEDLYILKAFTWRFVFDGRNLANSNQIVRHKARVDAHGYVIDILIAASFVALARIVRIRLRLLPF